MTAFTVLVGGCGSNDEPPSPTSTSTTRSAAVGLTVEEVLTWMDATDPGATLVCGETGPVDVGGVFACGGPSSSTGSSLVEHGATVVYVIDGSGRAAWTSGTDVPGPTEDLLRSYERVPKGLLCRDLLAPETDAFPFSGQGSTNPKLAFFWSLVYWSLEGEPERMDADGNGIPCETLYDPEVVSDVVAGGPAGE